MRLSLRALATAPALVVAVGGAVGAAVRWVVLEALEAVGAVGTAPMAWALLMVNSVGSFVVGAVLFASADGARELARLGLGVGFCGGLTTFSSFAVLTAHIARDGAPASAAAFVAASVVAAVAAVAMGIAAARKAGWSPVSEHAP